LPTRQRHRNAFAPSLLTYDQFTGFRNDSEGNDQRRGACRGMTNIERNRERACNGKRKSYGQDPWPENPSMRPKAQCSGASVAFLQYVAR